MSGEGSDFTDAALSGMFEMTVDLVRTKRHRLKESLGERYLRYLREEIHGTGVERSAIGDEIRQLLDALS